LSPDFNNAEIHVNIDNAVSAANAVNAVNAENGDCTSTIGD
jgi:hypothetical protein